jgi:hypothetical protein
MVRSGSGRTSWLFSPRPMLPPVSSKWPESGEVAPPLYEVTLMLITPSLLASLLSAVLAGRAQRRT